MELDLNVWKRGSQRAVHKPLLLLYALSQYQKGHDRFFSYKEIDEPLKDLLIEFGPYRKSHHPQYPFWRLQNDGIWELKNHEKAQPRSSNTDAKKSELLKYNVAGGLTKKEFDNITSSQDKMARAIGELLEKFFPETIHDDIVEKLDIQEYLNKPHKRDPDFRRKVLTAYGYKCAVCGFDCRLGHASIGLEAAHIKWHQSKGPSTVENGIAMCALHHKAFDRGVFTITENHTIEVSKYAYGSSETQRQIIVRHNNKISLPYDPTQTPSSIFLTWHKKNIFNNSKRDL
nr:HNH endonuclease [Parendozoicomonas sp. Alg238-R29]